MKGNPKSEGVQTCQKCYKYGHFTYECKNKQAYLYRPSKSVILKKYVHYLT